MTNSRLYRQIILVIAIVAIAVTWLSPARRPQGNYPDIRLTDAAQGKIGEFGKIDEPDESDESDEIGEADITPVLPALSDSSPEPQLERIFAAIDAHDLDHALRLAEGLIERYPTFHLAYLIKGDLLQARARPLANFGAAANASADRVADLRDEAIARLRAYREKPPVDDIPRYLLKLRDDQRHAIIIDTNRSRLYLYRNDGGRPRFVTDYYITQGKLGADKMAEGDKRTPLGVYRITSWLPPEKLADMYGHGAFPLDYPNEWDRRQGRGGSGIWLHGTPPNTFSRPPKASDGCVVLTNPDFDRLGENVQIGITPVIITSDAKWLKADAWQREREALAHALDAWRTDWESRDMDAFLSHYAADFQSKKQDFAAFAAQKRQVNRGKTWIKVEISNLSMFRNPGEEEIALVTFDQHYDSNNLANTMTKRQYWRRDQGQWKIIYEGAG
jgi:murein L,D-transpeptidase YafK